MTELRERDAMICRSCGQEERASEGYPCKDCGTFICIMCVFKGVVLCERCASSATNAAVRAGAGSAPGVTDVRAGVAAQRPAARSAPSVPDAMDWPEH